MKTDIPTLKATICSAFCADVQMRPVGDSVQVALPFSGRDEDAFTILVQPDAGGWKIHDAGTTLMRLSYEHNLDQIMMGSRGKLFSQIIGESGVQYDEGLLSIAVPADGLTFGLFRFGQALTRVSDLGLWTRMRTENTFMDDLFAHVRNTLHGHDIQRDYLVPDLQDAQNYPVDFYIPTSHEPLYLFGVANRDKARLATIILERLLRAKSDFDSLVVFRNMDDIPRADVSRLVNAANDTLANFDAVEDLDRKLRRKTA